MLTQKELKYYASLLQKKYRQEYKKFLVEGFTLIQEAINSNYKCEIIISSFLYAQKNNEILIHLKNKNLRTEIINQNLFEKLCDTKTPQGIIGVFLFPESNLNKSKNILEKEKLIVALENISDPGNLGTILRNCDWFGFNNILLSPDCAEVFNPKVIRASAGSLFHVNFYETDNFYDTLKDLKKSGYKIYCTDLDGSNIYELKPSEKSVVIFSSEAHGPSENLLQVSDLKITIPRFGNAESLNVASASAVVLSEMSKKIKR